MPAVKNVGEPCAGEPHARFEVAAGGDQTSRASVCRAVQAPPVDPPSSGAVGGWRAGLGVEIGPRDCLMLGAALGWRFGGVRE
jgi:hypothetical protein